MRVLVRELIPRDSKVFVCKLPALAGVNGPDDLIGACGDEGMTEVFAEADRNGAAVAHCEYGGGRFEIDDRGAWFIGAPDKNGNATPSWICGALQIVAMTRDSKSNSWGRLLEWSDADGVRHRWVMPLELLQSDGMDVRCELARQGLHIGPGEEGARATRLIPSGMANHCSGAMC